MLFDEVLDHVLRIDRIFRQPQGHLLLIGVSGAGKTTLSRFVAFMNGLSVFQIRVSLHLLLISISVCLLVWQLPYTFIKTHNMLINYSLMCNLFVTFF